MLVRMRVPHPSVLIAPDQDRRWNLACPLSREGEFRMQVKCYHKVRVQIA